MKEEKKMQLSAHFDKLSPQLCKILVVFWNNLSFTVDNIATFLGSHHNTVCHQIRVIYLKLGANDKQDLKTILQQTDCAAACQVCIARKVCIHQRNEYYEQ
jgi:DNA-binding NarL/FixJ family response regulator